MVYSTARGRWIFHSQLDDLRRCKDTVRLRCTRSYFLSPAFRRPCDAWRTTEAAGAQCTASVLCEVADCIPNVITDGCHCHPVILSVQDHYDVGVHTRRLKSCSALREKRTRWAHPKRAPTSRLTVSISLSLSQPLLYNTTISTVTSLLKTTVGAGADFEGDASRGTLDSTFVDEHLLGDIVGDAYPSVVTHVCNFCSCPTGNFYC